MRVLLAGGSGLVGSALAPMLTANGHEVAKLSRLPGETAERERLPRWNPGVGQINLDGAGPLDAVVHLAGETIAQRWTMAARRRIRESRVNGTRLLCETLACLKAPPRVLVCASACGFYGDRGAEWLDEASAPGDGFLAEVCREWEAASAPAVACGIRVVHLRIGLGLAREGGALAKLLPVFRLGFGGRLGDGRAYWSWIALEDLAAIILYALVNEALQNAVNAVSPCPVTNAEFTRALSAVLRRPALFPVPRFAVELCFGAMGREALLASFRVKPSKLLNAGFRFRFSELEPALRHLLR
jgi:hypothetical protein